MKVYCEAMIPKKIHYIWFGKKIKPELIQQCMKKTKSLLPDWEIHEWTEENYDIEQCKYMKEAYEREMYAFASDYARFDIYIDMEAFIRYRCRASSKNTEYLAA